MLLGKQGGWDAADSEVQTGLGDSWEAVEHTRVIRLDPSGALTSHRRWGSSWKVCALLTSPSTSTYAHRYNRDSAQHTEPVRGTSFTDHAPVTVDTDMCAHVSPEWHHPPRASSPPMRPVAGGWCGRLHQMLSPKESGPVLGVGWRHVTRCTAQQEGSVCWRWAPPLRRAGVTRAPGQAHPPTLTRL